MGDSVLGAGVEGDRVEAKVVAASEEEAGVAGLGV